MTLLEQRPKRGTIIIIIIIVRQNDGGSRRKSLHRRDWPRRVEREQEQSFGDADARVRADRRAPPPGKSSAFDDEQLDAMIAPASPIGEDEDDEEEEEKREEETTAREEEPRSEKGMAFLANCESIDPFLRRILTPKIRL